MASTSMQLPDAPAVRRGCGNGAVDARGVDDLRIARAQWIRLLVNAHRDEGTRHQVFDQPEGALQLRAAVELQAGLVATHALAVPARQHQAMKRRGHDLALRWKSRLPPLLASSRTGPITMSCDKALHMS